jgi:putative tricarboxylic transport membrane protein
VDGVNIIPMAMGLFGISEVLSNIDRDLDSHRDVLETRIRNLWPSLRDWREAKWPILRGTGVGFCLGMLPGAGAILSTFISYAIEKRISRHPERFGKGAIEGVAAPESANNAASGAAMIPLLSLGIPTNMTMALLFAALIIHGIQPGPLLIKNHPDVFWGLIASMYLGNVLLLLLNLPLIGIWVKVLKIPTQVLFPLILLFCLIGAYSVNSSGFDLVVMTLFGAVGYLMRRFRYEAAPLILAFVIGPRLEKALRQSLLISQGSFSIFINRPISGIVLGFAFLLLLLNFLPYVKNRRQKLKEAEQ